MQPKITIILPVYNVERYLRDALDSVVHQTESNIQIICVDDGSSDGSLEILKEYAALDERILIVSQKNGGGGAARNTALPHIRGKYTYFADADDWLDLDLCEKLFERAETTGAEAVYFCMKRTSDDAHTVKFDSHLPLLRSAPSEKRDLLLFFTATWLKMWRSDFLLSNDIRFTEGKRPYNDVFQSWKGCVLAQKIAILNEGFYNRRIRPGSYQQTINESHFIVVETMNEIGAMLRETQTYSLHKDVYLRARLESWRRTYFRLPPEYRREFAWLIRRSLNEEDHMFWRSDSNRLAPRKVRHFYSAVTGKGIAGQVKLQLLELRSWLGRKLRSGLFVPLGRVLHQIFPRKQKLGPSLGTISAADFEASAASERFEGNSPRRAA